MKYNILHSDAIDYMQRLDNNSVTMTLTDIPYGVINREGGIRNMDKGDADIMTFDLTQFVAQIMRVTSGSIYIFCSSEQVSGIRKQLDRDLTTRHCIWEKTNPSPMHGQRFWLSSIENCVFARKSKATFNEHCQSAVWRESVERSIKDHPTPKSILLMKRLIEASSNPGDTVLDPCMGSGSVGIACKMTNRDFLGSDINPMYVSKALQRIDELNLGDNPWIKKLLKREKLL